GYMGSHTRITSRRCRGQLQCTESIVGQEQMMGQAQWVGIDVAKRHLDVAIGDTGRVRRYPNTPAGQRRLLATLREVAVAGIVLEATGAYYQVLMATLQAAGYAPSALNPQWIKAFKR